MADNYIERQYEQYEARKAAWKKSKQYAKRTSLKSSSTIKPKRVFVTGGANGIGKCMVESFTKAQYQVAFCDIQKEEGQRLAQATGSRFIPVDITQKEDLESAFMALLKEWGDLDILINNAGISKFSSITETTVEDFDTILSTNLRPVFILARLWAIHRKESASLSRYGRMINICSTRYLMSEPGSEGYAASKGGIYSLTHALSLSLSPYFITVNSISPGWIETKDYSLLRPEDHAQHPSQRVGKPEDIARACLFICHEENDFLNGENITIDGGMTKKMMYIE